MPARQQSLLKRGAFRPKRYAVSVKQLAAWRAAGEGTTRIAARYGCDQSTVRNWLIVFGLPTRLKLIEPVDRPVGTVARMQANAVRTALTQRDPAAAAAAADPADNPADNPAAPERQKWAARLAFLIAERKWRRVWGPLPSEAGCFMPNPLRAELAALILQQPDAITLV